METTSNGGEMRMKNSPTMMHPQSNYHHHNTSSSPENSPQSDRMDTSAATLTTTMELNGKSDGCTSSQEYCLRWNNHQTSLLSTLPQLLDQSHLSDCTIVAERRKIRAHRLVLSGCSTFFSELFHNLESGMQQQSCHPVIVLPPLTSFASLAALITFMYSGEVNVYENQISKLLELAETLGIKGLTEINNEHMNGLKNRKQPEESTSPSPDNNSEHLDKLSPKHHDHPTTPSSSPFDRSTQLTPKLLTPAAAAAFDPFLSRPYPPQFNFYPHHLLTQPHGFSPNRHPFPAMLSQLPSIPPQSPQFNAAKSNTSSSIEQDVTNCRNILEEFYKKDKQQQAQIQQSMMQAQQAQQQHDKRKMPSASLRKIDKIAENLRGSANSNSPPSSASPSSTKSFLDHFNQMSVVKKETSSPANNPFPMSPQQHFLNEKGLMKAASVENLMNYTNEAAKKAQQQTMPSSPTLAGGNVTPTSATNAGGKIPNSKLFAKCFICSKLLSNQYNLRVHLETHQNMRYACTVCSHVSRSKDALRKHISYRHPGTPSPCESENRRKRTKLASQIQQIQAQQMMKEQLAAGNLMFPPSNPGTPNLMDPANANQLALLQSFTSEMREIQLPSQQQQQQLFQHQPTTAASVTLHPAVVKMEINNNGDEQNTNNGT